MTPTVVWLVLGAILAGGFLLTSTASASGEFESKVRRFAGAIAFAEGFWTMGQVVKENSRPARDNNPGDIEGKNWRGQVASDGPYIVFGTLEQGWDALYNMVRLDLSGKSHVRTPDMTISDFAYSYTATEQDSWSENVATYLGVTRDTKISDWLGGAN